MRMIRKIVGALTALTVCGSLTACGASNADGKTLSILVEGGSPAETVAKDTAAGFEKLTGYNVKVDTVPYSTTSSRPKRCHAAACMMWHSSTLDGSQL